MPWCARRWNREYWRTPYAWEQVADLLKGHTKEPIQGKLGQALPLDPWQEFIERGPTTKTKGQETTLRKLVAPEN